MDKIVTFIILIIMGSCAYKTYEENNQNHYNKGYEDGFEEGKRKGKQEACDGANDSVRNYLESIGVCN